MPSMAWMLAMSTRSEVPDIIEFVTGPQWMDKPNLYPRQATMLKIITLRDDLFTDYDRRVIEEWTTGFRLREGVVADEDTSTMRYEGDWGIPPDIYERIAYLKEHNYRWFRTVLAVIGRRGGKGHLGALLTAYVLWNYLAEPDPRVAFGVDDQKRLSCQVFAGKKGQAQANQWGDIAKFLTSAPCFMPFISKSTSDMLSLYSKADMLRAATTQMDTTMDMAAFEVVPKEASTMAARGPASFAQLYDEGAHMVATGVSRSMAEVWESATPALDQFGEWAWIYSGSSPWAMDGKFYELVQDTLSVDIVTRAPIWPENLVIQLESWDPYKDWELTVNGDFVLCPEREVTLPDGSVVTKPPIYARPLRGALQEYDAKMQRLERANPDTFRVERRSKWAVAMNTYLPEQHVRRMFHPWNGEVLQMQERGRNDIAYVMHGDPGQTGSNFGFAVGHSVPDPHGGPIPHVVFDWIKCWKPQDFPANEMDYIAIEAEIGEVMDRFLPVMVTFDQWQSISMIQRLSVRSRQHYRVADVHERTATGPLNWTTAETFKVALSLDLVHCFAGETRYLTRDGVKSLVETVGTKQMVLTDGAKWVEADIRSFGRQRLYKVTLERHGTVKEIHATAGHRWFVKGKVWERTGRAEKRKITYEDAQEIRYLYAAGGVTYRELAEKFGCSVQNVGYIIANKIHTQPRTTGRQRRARVERATLDLSSGDVLWSMLPPSSGLASVRVDPVGVMAGFVFGDGSNGTSGTQVTLWGAKDEQILPFFSHYNSHPRVTPGGVRGRAIQGLPLFMKHPPDLNESRGYLLGWLAGYFAADGTVSEAGQAILGSVSREDIEVAIAVCHRLGIGVHPLRVKPHNGGFRNPGDGACFYEFQFIGSTLLDRAADFFLIREHRERFLTAAERADGRQQLGWRVVSVEETEREEEVFCATVPGTASFTLEDYILTGNCPYHEMLELECLYLQKKPGDKVDHPDTGPCTTKDVYDAASIVVHSLIGQDVARAYGEQFSALRPGYAMPGLNTPPHMVGPGGAALPSRPGTSQAERDAIAAQFSKFTQQRRAQHRRMGRGR